MKKLIIGALALAAATTSWAVTISPLQGATETPQWKSGNPEWFSRYSSFLDTADLAAFKNAPGNGLSLYATSSKVEITYLGTGATRNSNLFLAYAGNAAFDTASFWAPVYASGGTNNLGTYNPVNSSNALFETRAGCSYAQAKAGNTCQVSQIGQTRTISGLTTGDSLVFGLQTLPLVYGNEVNIPNGNYFFTGSAANNSDTKGWADSSFHAKVLQISANEYLVGFEDTWLGRGSNSDRDYNDMIFLFKGVSVTPVPELDTSVMILVGLGAMSAVARRRRKQ